MQGQKKAESAGVTEDRAVGLELILAGTVGHSVSLIQAFIKGGEAIFCSGIAAFLGSCHDEW